MKTIEDIKVYALEHEVPIMQDDTLNFISRLIQERKYEHVLELGTAIGYSAISLCMNNPMLDIVTLERDEERYLLALENILHHHLKHRIHTIWIDIYDYKTTKQFDMLIIDAAKAQNQAFYDKFKENVRPGGVILVDNMNFHGFKSDTDELAHRRNLRMMLSKIEAFDEYIANSSDIISSRYDIGDGLLLIEK